MHGTADRHWITTAVIIFTSQKHGPCEYRDLFTYIPHIASSPFSHRQNTSPRSRKNSYDAPKLFHGHSENGCSLKSFWPSGQWPQHHPKHRPHTIQPHYHGQARRVRQPRTQHPLIQRHHSSHGQGHSCISGTHGATRHRIHITQT